MWLETQELHSGVWSGKWDGKMEWEWDATSSCRLELQRAKLWGKKKNLKSVSCVFRCWKASKHFFFFQISSDFKPWKFRNYFTHEGWGNKGGGIFFLFLLKMKHFLVGSLWRKSWLIALLVTKPYRGAASRVTESLDFLPVKQVEVG